MRALCSWVPGDLAIPLRSGFSDPMRERSIFGVTPCPRRVVDSTRRRSEFRHDSASLPQAPVPKDLLGLSGGRNLSRGIRTVTRLRMYSTHLSGRVQQYGVRGFYWFGYRHVPPGGACSGGGASLPADRPDMLASVLSRSWERRSRLGNVRLHWPTLCSGPRSEERL